MSKNTSPYRYFFVELLISFVFFIIAMIIGLSIFASGHALTSHSQKLNYAMLNTQSAIEIAKAGQGDNNYIANALDCRDASSLSVYYDENFAQCDKGNEAFTLTINTDVEDDMLVIHATMFKGSEVFYEIDTKCYLGQSLEDTNE